MSIRRAGAFYDPVDLNNSYLLAQDGLTPSEGNPQFHQQMVYAVAHAHDPQFRDPAGDAACCGAERTVQVFANGGQPRRGPPSPHRSGGNALFVRRLRIYPHALREANAYYSPDKRGAAVRFTFRAQKTRANAGQMVFTCLSHDIIAP